MEVLEAAIVDSTFVSTSNKALGKSRSSFFQDREGLKWIPPSIRINRRRLDSLYSHVCIVTIFQLLVNHLLNNFVLWNFLVAITKSLIACSRLL